MIVHLCEYNGEDKGRKIREDIVIKDDIVENKFFTEIRRQGAGQ